MWSSAHCNGIIEEYQPSLKKRVPLIHIDSGGVLPNEVSRNSIKNKQKKPSSLEKRCNVRENPDEQKRKQVDTSRTNWYNRSKTNPKPWTNLYRWFLLQVTPELHFYWNKRNYILWMTFKNYVLMIRDFYEPFWHHISLTVKFYEW